MGLLSVDEGIAFDSLTEAGLTRDLVAETALGIVGEGAGLPTTGQIPFTPRSKKVLELALRYALSLGHNYVGPEHILLGLLHEKEGVAPHIFATLGIQASRVEEIVKRRLQERPTAAEPRPPVEGEEQLAGEDSLSEESEQEDNDQGEEFESIPTHSDRPAKQDELGRARFAAVVAERIRRVRAEDTEAPVEDWRQRRNKIRNDINASRQASSFLLHIHAPWGAGKSSFLNFLARDLRNRRSVSPKGGVAQRLSSLIRLRRPEQPSLSQWVVVEFSAWQHQRLVPPWWWLLAEVQRSCSKELWHINRVRWAWFWVRDILWRLWNGRIAIIAALLFVGIGAAAWALNWFGLPEQKLTVVQAAVLTLVSAVGLATAGVEAVRGAARWLAVGSAEGAARYLKRAHDPLHVYQRRFRWLIRSAGRPIAVFIDDLDRCRAGYVVELLEGIQTLFVSDPVTYVVAADRSWLCSSFTSTYEDFKNDKGEVGRSLGHLFLEKTFQVSLELPPLSEQDKERYWLSLMEGDAEESNDSTHVDHNQAELASEFADASTQAEVEAGIKRLIDAGKSEEAVRAAAVRRLNAPRLQDVQQAQLARFAPLLEGNPRSMKRLMNAYGLERDRLVRDGYFLTREERSQLVLLTIMKLRWPELAVHLGESPEDIRYILRKGRSVPNDHPYASLMKRPDLRQLFDGTCVAEALTETVLVRFPDRSTN